jgi:predicted metal-dependent hydrolase
MSTNNVNLMEDAVNLIVKAIQERKEREAATAIDKFTAALNTWFQSEAPLYNTIGSNYAIVMTSLAEALIQRGQVDPSSFLNAVFTPYGLTPQLTDPTLKSQVQAYLAEQVAQKSAALAAAQQTATTNMEKSLSEMASRIHLVATDKPMAIRMAPITLTEVQNWISLVPQIAPAPATAVAKSSTSTGTKSKSTPTGTKGK